MGTITSNQSAPGSNGNEGVLHTFRNFSTAPNQMQFSIILGDPFGGESYSSTCDMLSVF